MNKTESIPTRLADLKSQVDEALNTAAPDLHALATLSRSLRELHEEAIQRKRPIPERDQIIAERVRVRKGLGLA